VKRLIAILLFSVVLSAQSLVVISGARVVDGTGAPARVATVVIRAAPFTPGGAWHTVKIPFATLRRRAAGAGPWDAKDARALLFELGGPAGSSVWMELDNVRFY
jgi:hypothetical protein